ncbi:hypothetical protein G7068_15595 [Leucobacter viscericola]|uniref:YrhK-like protein n=1 Tax=Leucobacter viscericola TaxID=2714935 RepID=A0A6G7XIN3_9MICO|nr:hypothetical protein [Leucobacter viscericola]QIK64474.1 hypothetical protein G7068_15595 [Leucobacter viscericola]
MSAASIPVERTVRPFFVPTLAKQCWIFMIGSALFALGSAPGFGSWAGAEIPNLCYFIGALFFTTAGFIQLFLSGAVSVPVNYAPGRMVRAEWLAASTQSFGTLMFNISTTAAITAKSIKAQEHFVWNPDAGGSVAFLVSGVLAFVAYSHSARSWDLGKRAWWAVAINFVGCVAFAYSAAGAYILPSGSAANDSLANNGTFIGALCFFFASFLVLPAWDRSKKALGGDPR